MTRFQPASSLCGKGGQCRPRGDAASFFGLGETVLENAASDWPLMIASKEAAKPETFTFSTSSQVKPAKAR